MPTADRSASIGTAVELVKNIMVGESREKAEAMVIHGYRAMHEHNVRSEVATGGRVGVPA